MEVHLEEVEIEEVENRKENRKQYLNAVIVIGVVGLLIAMGTGIPLGAQIAVPAFNSVAYFFGHGSTGESAQWIYYWRYCGEDALHAFIHAIFEVGFGIILDYVGVNIIAGVDDILAAGTEAVVGFLATIFAAYLPWWLGPAVLPYIATIAVL